MSDLDHNYIRKIQEGSNKRNEAVAAGLAKLKEEYPNDRKPTKEDLGGTYTDADFQRFGPIWTSYYLMYKAEDAPDPAFVAQRLTSIFRNSLLSSNYETAYELGLRAYTGIREFEE